MCWPSVYVCVFVWNLFSDTFIWSVCTQQSFRYWTAHNIPGWRIHGIVPVIHVGMKTKQMWGKKTLGFRHPLAMMYEENESRGRRFLSEKIPFCRSAGSCVTIITPFGFAQLPGHAAGGRRSRLTARVVICCFLCSSIPTLLLWNLVSSEFNSEFEKYGHFSSACQRLGAGRVSRGHRTSVCKIGLPCDASCL